VVQTQVYGLCSAAHSPFMSCSPALTVTAENQTLPKTNLPQIAAILVCEIDADFSLELTTVESRWTVSDGGMIEVGYKYFIGQGPGIHPCESILVVRYLIYTDADIYTCEVRDIRDSDSPGPWIPAQVHLQLLGNG